MKTVCKINQCAGCKACVDVCKKEAISVEDALNAMNAIIDEKRCIQCGACERVCPNNSIVQKRKPQVWYQGWNSNTRKTSSSGGAAAGLIEAFIHSGGYVAACLFKDGEFVFDITNDLDYAKNFAGSKYVKSNPVNIYSKVAKELKTGNKVLFVGLPCQVAAVKNYVKNTDNLYTIDLICHGSPSPQLLEKFLEENKVNIHTIENLKFRNKTAFGLESGYKRISFDAQQDLYTFAFLTSLDYTENCYSCRYATLDRVSDITLGDSWGSELSREEQKKGISLILCQTEKGVELVKSAGFELEEVDLDKAVTANHQLRHPSEMPDKRNTFFENIDRGFHYAISKCYPKMYYKRRLKTFLQKTKIIGGGQTVINEYDVSFKE